MPGPLAPDRLVGRARTISHRSGLRLATPLLVPSFSSKGFSFVKRTFAKQRRIVSELVDVLDVVGPTSLTQSALFSAYDLYYDLLPGASAYLEKPAITFLDSGGYEASNDFDEGQVLRPTYRHRKWSEARLHKVIQKLPKHIPLVIVSHDSRGTLINQAKRAARFFGAYPQHMHNFLIKPRLASKSEIDLFDVTRNVAQLGQFDIIGVTEKELGNSMLVRLEAINKLRHSLDAAGIKAPLHIFGSLDPMTVPLYFAAGAEIFDGLSWLRFFYHDGLSVYRDHAGVLTGRGVQARWDAVRSYALGENLALLRQLEIDLRNFNSSRDLGLFGSRADHIAKGLRALDSQIAGGA